MKTNDNKSLFDSLFPEHVEIAKALINRTATHNTVSLQAVYKFAYTHRAEIIKLYEDGKTIDDAQVVVTTMGGSPVQSTASFARTEQILKERYNR
ncbi:hypothetical protein [Pseudomonas sp. GV047]|uniref:hypothetical protein n=1 Tax=Pseudomonas sp. GV047 TaxID=2135751 RepID=UPI000D370697|nr:hypothetical protein [Pseudomonas sp. GV047]PUB40057.1 hypothetical protein C8K58_11443 [Pseudomonas sp. GV047]